MKLTLNQAKKKIDSINQATKLKVREAQKEWHEIHRKAQEVNEAFRKLASSVKLKASDLIDDNPSIDRIVEAIQNQQQVKEKKVLDKFYLLNTYYTCLPEAENFSLVENPEYISRELAYVMKVDKFVATGLTRTYVDFNLDTLTISFHLSKNFDQYIYKHNINLKTLQIFHVLTHGKPSEKLFKALYMVTNRDENYVTAFNNSVTGIKLLTNRTDEYNVQLVFDNKDLFENFKNNLELQYNIVK